jgi:hypothetical protein
MKNFFLLFFSAVSFSFSQSVFPLNNENGEARDRTYHVIHYKIEVSFDELKKMLMGKVTTTLVPFISEFTTLEFDAENMVFKKVSLGKTVLPVDSLNIPVSPKKGYISSSRILHIPISRGRSGPRVRIWTIISGFHAGIFPMTKRHPKLSER